jgi:hypothetical protein
VADTSTQPLAGNFQQLRKLNAVYPHLSLTAAIASGLR